MRADVNHGLDLFPFAFFVKAQLGSKIKIVRCGVHRVDAENQERTDVALVDVRAKLAQRFQVIDGMCLYRLSVVQRRADVAEGSIDGVNQGMDFGRLLLARDDQSAARVLLQIFYHGIEPFLDGGRELSAASQA